MEGLNGGNGDTTLKSTCYSPSAFWHSTEKNEHQQHEFRVSTPDDWRLRAIVGAYWEANKLYDETGWMYKTIPECTSDGASGTAGNSGKMRKASGFGA